MTSRERWRSLVNDRGAPRVERVRLPPARTRGDRSPHLVCSESTNWTRASRGVSANGSLVDVVLETFSTMSTSVFEREHGVRRPACVHGVCSSCKHVCASVSGGWQQRSCAASGAPRLVVESAADSASREEPPKAAASDCDVTRCVRGNMVRAWHVGVSVQMGCVSVRGASSSCSVLAPSSLSQQNVRNAAAARQAWLSVFSLGARARSDALLLLFGEAGDDVVCGAAVVWRGGAGYGRNVCVLRRRAGEGRRGARRRPVAALSPWGWAARN